MEFITRSQKRKIIITTFIYLFLILIAAQLLYIRKVANMTPIYVVNVSVDIFGMIMGYVLFICCLIDVQKTGANYFISSCC